MKFSYNWINENLDQKLPTPDILSKEVTMHAFEVEEIQKSGDDYILDIKVLPNRAHDCLSIIGMSKMIGAVLSLPTKIKDVSTIEITKSNELEVLIENTEACPRFAGLMVKNVKVAESPEWLKQKVSAMGQKPINNLVDLTNYLMFLLGKPTHVFDSDKLIKKDGKAKISVRESKQDEKFVDIHGKEWTLPAGVTLVCDGNTENQTALAVGGIKGGKTAEIDLNTKNIIIESANFDAVAIRKASTALGLRTDASARFEKGLSSELVIQSMQWAAKLIKELCTEAIVEGITDYYPNPEQKRTIEFKAEQISTMLGITVSNEEIKDCLNRLAMPFGIMGEDFMVTIPFERIDLETVEDMAEDIGGLLGYDRIPATPLPKFEKQTEVNKTYYYASKIRDCLIALGWDEVYSYAFVENGEVELANSLAQDKSFLRPALADSMQKALEFNGRNADLLGLDQIKIFEIGKCFQTDGEFTSLALGVFKTKNDKTKSTVEQIIAEALEAINKTIDSNLQPEHGIFEVNLDEVIAKLPEPIGYDLAELPKPENNIYQAISQYPFALRDIACFTKETTQAEEVAELIKANAQNIKRLTLFDVFTKKFEDGTSKTSYAYRIVFQSDDKTLSEEELNVSMEKINKAMGEKGWEVR